MEWQLDNAGASAHSARRRSPRLLLAAVVALMLALVPLQFTASAEPVSAPPAPRDDRTIATWGTAVVSAAPSETNRINNQTVRQIVHVSAGGDQVRIKLSNRYGSTPLDVQDVRVAVSGDADQFTEESGGQLTFGGQTSFRIPAYGEFYSDWLPFTVAPLSDLTIDLYLPGDTSATTSPLTIHSVRPSGQIVSYLADGNQAGSAEFATTASRTAWYFLSGVDVSSRRAVGGTIVAFGDSITDGSASTVDANGRWPDYLARRLQTERSGPAYGVVNMGISGNRVLSGATTNPAAQARFDRDVLATTGVTHVIVLEGINDISGGATAESIIQGHRQLIRRAHNHGLPIYGATLTPFERASDAREAVRLAVNEWIRTSGEYDAVLDFDAAIRQPGNPRATVPAYDSGDTLHPNSAGLEAMANSINLHLFLRSKVTAPTLDPSDINAVTTWGAPMVSANPSAANRVNDQTLRQIAHISNGGDRVRVKISNRWGTSNLTVQAAQVALRSTDTGLVDGLSRPLTFGGSPSINVAAGAEVLSDWVDLRAPDLSDIAVDLYLPGDTSASTSPLTVRNGALQTTYVSEQGNHVGESVAFPVASTRSTWNFLAGIDTSRQGPTSTVVAFGDSITEGLRSTANTNRRWPDVLAGRLMQLPPARQMAVVNQGISGNRVWSGGGSTNPSALARFDQDVASQAGVSHVIVMLGINDISGGATPDQVIGALRQVITRAHARGLTIIGGTLTPFGNASDAREQSRLEVNDWIRNSGEFDGVVDFDAALRDPANPRRMLAAYDSGDSLHPSDAGYEAMGNAIPLELFQVGAGHANNWTALEPAA